LSIGPDGQERRIVVSSVVYERIAERIIALLEQGTVPWHKPWKASSGLPRNLVSKRAYRGINLFLLLAMGYDSPFWLTFRQVTNLGGRVKPKEHGCPVVFWKMFEIEDKETGELKEVPMLRYYHVFNTEQCEGIEDVVARAQRTERTASVIAKPEEIVDNMPQRPSIRRGQTKAFYSRREDIVGVPSPQQFDRDEDYYSTLFHELVHATGHETRLNRATLTEKAGFGTDPYCKEELIAEMGAAFLCGYTEIAERTIQNSAAYVQSWLTRLRADRRLVVQAAAQAQRAADFVLNRHATGSEVGHD
jgi:antirestriction protein ArdC